jgi:hypothetical protein
MLTKSNTAMTIAAVLSQDRARLEDLLFLLSPLTDVAILLDRESDCLICRR